MANDYEVDDILNSINNKEKTTPDLTPSDDLLNALKSFKTDLNEDKGESEEQGLEAPKIYDEVKSVPEDNSQDGEKKGSVISKIGEAFSQATADIDSVMLKRIGLILVAIIAAVAIIFGGIKVANYAKTAYVKSYEKKYEVDFPDGILKEFCDEYGKDQSLAGNLTIEDTNTDVRVYSKLKDNTALLDRGSDVKCDQHIRAISVDKSLADLESIYSTPEGFLNSSQKITFKTLLGEEEYRVVAAYYTNTDPKDDNGYVFPYNTYGNLTSKSFYHFQDRIKSRRLYDTNYTLLEENYILSVSVPSDFMPNFRFVTVCVKTDKKFKKSETATPNNRIHYPQVWYDKNKQDNPFYLAGKWYPEIVLSNGKTKKLTMKDFQ